MPLPRGLLPDVAAALGCDLADATMATFQQAADDGLEEFEQLDWKRVYPANAYGRSEIAKDVAALANARGGVIVVGVAEADGQADAVEPVAVGDAEERHVTQIVATRTHPRVAVSIASVRDDNDSTRGVLVVVVPPSPLAPHAIEDGERLRYPVRRGTITSSLREYEIRETYLRMHTSLAARRARAPQLVDEAVGHLRDDHAIRLLVAVTPDQAGWAPVTQQRRDNLQAMTPPRPATLTGDAHDHGAGLVTLGAVRLAWEQVHGNGFDRMIDHHDDGSSVYGCTWSIPGRDAGGDGNFWTRDGRALIPQQMLVAEATRAVEVAAEHAAAAGATGTATAVAYLSPGQNATGASMKSLGRWGAEAARGPVAATPEDLSVTVELPSGGDGPAIVQTARRLLLPLFQAHGFAEVPVLNHDGTVKPGSGAPKAQLQRWAERLGIEVLE